jgi:hypothetical protein
VLVIRHRPGADGALEEDLGRVGQGDGDDGWLLGREGEESGAEEIS